MIRVLCLLQQIKLKLEPITLFENFAKTSASVAAEKSMRVEEK